MTTNQIEEKQARYKFGYYAGMFSDSEWKVIEKKIKAASQSEKALIKRELLCNIYK